VAFAGRQRLHPFLQNGFALESNLLLNVTDAILFGNSQLTIVKTFLTDKDTQQSGLAVPVAADKPYPLAGIDLEAYIFEEKLFSEAFAEIFNADHGCKIRFEVTGSVILYRRSFRCVPGLTRLLNGDVRQYATGGRQSPDPP